MGGGGGLAGGVQTYGPEMTETTKAKRGNIEKTRGTWANMGTEGNRSEPGEPTSGHERSTEAYKETKV